MIIRRVSSMKYQNYIDNVHILEANMKNLKYQTQTFNDWEQKYYDLRQSYCGMKGRKKLLVKMSEPKHHKKVVGMLEGLRKEKGQSISKSQFVEKMSQIYKNKKDENKKSKIPKQYFVKNLSENANPENEISLSGTQIKISIKKKLLQKHWLKIDSYRREYKICNTDRILHTGAQQKNILRKVVKNRSSSTCGFRQYGNLTKSSFSEW